MALRVSQQRSWGLVASCGTIPELLLPVCAVAGVRVWRGVVEGRGRGGGKRGVRGRDEGSDAEM